MTSRPAPHYSTEVDVLIVGAGPAGAVAAHTLADRGLSVLCLEQGDWVDTSEIPGGQPEFELLTRTAWNWEPNTRRRWQDYPLDLADADVSAPMFAGVGGTSILYGAHWHRLLPSDFRVHSLDGVGTDWPIQYEDLHPFYDRVDQFIGVAGLGGDPAYPDQDFPMPPHPLGAAGMKMAAAMNHLGWHWWPGTQAIPSTAFKAMGSCVRWGVCEHGCPAGAKASFDVGYWPHATALGVELITHARVAQITVERTGLANGAIWLDVEGREHRVKANAVVLAANGVGTPRLLLLSDDRCPDGLANSSGLVGKNLMLHPNCASIGVYDDDVQSWNGPAGQLLYSLQFYETDRSRGFVRGSKWSLMPVPGVLRALDLFNDRPFELRWGSAAHDLAASAGHVLSWSACIEDLPEETNSVTLDKTLTDTSGLPAPKLTYRLSENSRQSLAFAMDRMREVHRAAGAWHVVDQPNIASGHLLGTARMGTDPETSVVDEFCRAHDIPNLLVVDGSVMVTSGAVNPTSTITALALRASEHLADTARDQRCLL